MKPDKDNFHLTYFSDQLPTSLDFHWGDAFSVFFLISGRASYTMEKYTRRLHPGELWLISSHYRPPQPISFGCQPPCKGYLLQIGPEFLHRAAPLIADLTSCFSSGERGCVLVQPDAPTLSCLEEICGKILLCQKEEAFGSNALSHIYLLEFLIYLNRAYFSRPSMFHKEYLENEKVNEVLAYIDENLSSDLTLERLADLCFISKYHLSREFGRVVGTSVHRYLIQKRLVMAKQMMRQGMSSTEVYQHCGFGDYSNFYRAFKAEYHITPKEFLARLRQPVPDAPGMFSR